MTHWTSADWRVLSPLIILGVSAIVTMLGIAFYRSHRLTLAITLAGLAGTIVSLPGAAGAAPRQVASLLTIDGFALLFIGLIAAAAGVVAIFSYSYLERRDGDPEEYYVLLLISTLGAAVLAAASHFVSFFLGLELLSVTLYGLAAYPQRKEQPLEAGVKYLVLAAAAAAFLLYGMALIYMATGTLSFQALAGVLLTGAAGAHSPLLLPGAALILVGIGFKLGLFPFHLWTPDVYQGAPAPVGAFIATASKAGMFAVFLRFFNPLAGFGPNAFVAPAAATVITVLAIGSMAFGNLLALRQRNVKRLLGYSSIAHMGYILVAFEAAAGYPELAASAIAFYFVAYFITTLGAFGVIAACSNGESEPEDLDEYRGLFWRRPGLAFVFTAMLMSLAGIPLTAGFIAKYYVVLAGAGTALWLLLITLIVTSVVGLFYYLRVVVALFATPGGDKGGSEDEAALNPDGPLAPAAPTFTGLAIVTPIAPADGWLLAVLLGLLLWVGVYPQPVFNLIAALPLR